MEVDKVEKKPLSKTRGILVLLVLALLCIAFLHSAYTEVQLLASVEKAPILVRLSGFTIPAIVLLPIFFTLGVGIFKRLFSNFTEIEMKRGLRFIVVNFFLFIPVWLIFTMQQSKWLHEQGYVKCPWYSTSTMGAKKVWVRGGEYCIKDGTQVRFELFDWLKEFDMADKKPTPQEVSNKIEELLKSKVF